MMSKDTYLTQFVCLFVLVSVSVVRVYVVCLVEGVLLTVPACDCVLWVNIIHLLHFL